MAKIVQDQAEFEICLAAVRKLGTRTLLEIGSAEGGTIGLWLEAGVEHVVSLDISHDSIDTAFVESRRQPNQTVTYLTGNSLRPETIVRLDKVRHDLAIERFDVAFIDGAHSYEAVKTDFATCLGRTRHLIIFNDSVLNSVRSFLDEIARAPHPYSLVNVVNPNRRLPCPPGQCRCPGDFVAENGAGNMLMFLEKGGPVETSTRALVAERLQARAPGFEPTRRYFHHRGLQESPAYAAFWRALIPPASGKMSWFLRESDQLFQRARDLHLAGDLEEGLFAARAARAARKIWYVHAIRRLLKRARGRWLRLVAALKTPQTGR